MNQRRRQKKAIIKYLSSLPTRTATIRDIYKYLKYNNIVWKGYQYHNLFSLICKYHNIFYLDENDMQKYYQFKHEWICRPITKLIINSFDIDDVRVRWIP